jgi:hypothetical protein
MLEVNKLIEIVGLKMEVLKEARQTFSREKLLGFRIIG